MERREEQRLIYALHKLSVHGKDFRETVRSIEDCNGVLTKSLEVFFEKEGVVKQVSNVGDDCTSTEFTLYGKDVIEVGKDLVKIGKVGRG